MGKHELTDKEKLFRTQLGQQVDVQRTVEKGENVARANAKLKDVGQDVNPLPANLKYHGSAAIHIFYNETLKQAFFVSQANTLGDTNEQFAIAAIKDLQGSVMEFFGRRRPKMRSGF